MAGIFVANIASGIIVAKLVNKAESEMAYVTYLPAQGLYHFESTYWSSYGLNEETLEYMLASYSSAHPGHKFVAV